MAVQKNEATDFTKDWEKTAAWAQSQGYSKNDYYPVYQMDSKRLLQGEQIMSTAERTRAIQAAANPNAVTPVPGNAPNPTNVMGNTVNDLRNIFTGLAPNHLVANIFDTAKNAVVHPETVVKPIADVAGGLTSGNMGQVKQGLELAAGLNGPGSLLSWLPGVYVAGEIAQGGVGEALSHPVVSFLDVAPFADAGSVITAGADASRSAALASRLGYSTTDELRNASIPGMAKQFVLSRKVADVPIVGKKAEALTDVNGKPVTIGDALDTWITAHTGMGKTLSSLMKGMLNINYHQTDLELALFRPAELAMNQLDEAQKQQVFGLLDQTDPRAKGRTTYDVANDDNIDEKVRTAYSSYDKVRNWIADTALMHGDDVSFARPDGTIGIVHTAGAPSPVISARDQLDAAKEDLIKAMGPSHKWTKEIAQLDKEGNVTNAQFGKSWLAARQAAEKLDGTERYADVQIDEKGKLGQAPKVRLDLRRAGEALFGTDDPVSGAREEGLAGQIQTSIGEGDFAAVQKFSEAMLRRLKGSGPNSIDPMLDPAFSDLAWQTKAIHDWAVKRNKLDTKFKASLGDVGRRAGGAGYATIREPLKAYLAANRKFARAVRENPTAEWVDVAKEQFVKNLLAEEDRYHRFDDFSKLLKEKENWSQKEIDKLRADPVKIAQLLLMYAEEKADSPSWGGILDRNDIERLTKSGIDEANKLRESGHQVQWAPHVSSLDVRDTDTGRYGIHLASTGRAKKSSRAFERKQSMGTAQRYDVVAALHTAAREQLQIDGTIEYAETVLAPHITTGSKAFDTITHDAGLRDVLMQRFDEAAGKLPGELTPEARDGAMKDAVNVIMRDHFNMVKFSPTSYFGFSLPRWTGDDQYLPRGIAEALPKMLDKGQFPLDGIYNKATGLFRFSILDLSPRYTAHVVFGGTFLLALRSSPHIIEAIPKAWRTMKDQGEVPRGTFDGATQRGIDPVEYQTFHQTPLAAGSRVFHQRTGADMARLVSEEHIETVQKVKLAAATPVHWLKAVGATNRKFTNWASAFQRSVAYWDAYGKNAKRFTDPLTGEISTASKAQLEHDAMEQTYKVLGDLKSMTPLERGVFANVMPFYGWTKHILQYVLSYPADHPFRAATLAVMATQNSDSVASGLPTRLQFLMFLGSPDVQGNVNAVDVRALDPLRDVANYATLAGWVSSLNPVLTAPLAMIDPQIIFGGNPLYPNVTYDQFYGIENAGSQGSPLTALEQFVPQTSALDTALNLSGQFRNLAATNPNEFAKNIFEALNIPFAQVQHVNLKQIAAKDEIDRYHVASTAANNAFQSGNFSSIKGLADVPDPLNVDFDVQPGQLQALYQQLLTEYPGQAPATTALPPPSPSI